MQTKQGSMRKITDKQYLCQERNFDVVEGGSNFNYIDVYVKTVDSHQKIFVGSYYIHEKEAVDDSIMNTKIQYNRHFVAIVSRINGKDYCVKLYDTNKREVYNLSTSEPFDYKKYLHVSKDTFHGVQPNILYQQQQEEYQKHLKQKVKTWKLNYKNNK